MIESEYRKLIDQYEKEFGHLMRKLDGKYFEHHYLNIKLDEIFKKVEESKLLSNQDLMDYLSIRSENDRINSEFNMISTETNAVWIKIQELDKMIIQQNNVNPIFIGIDKQNGILRYYLDFINNQ